MCLYRSFMAIIQDVYKRQIKACSPCFHFLFLDIARSLLITAEFVRINADTAGHGTEICIIAIKLRYRHIRHDLLLSAV